LEQDRAFDTDGDSDGETPGTSSGGNASVPVEIKLPEAIEDADLVLNDLARLAALLRQSGSSSRFVRADESFDPKDPKHDELRSHLTRIVLFRPKTLNDRRGRLWSDLGPYPERLEEKQAYWSHLTRPDTNLFENDCGLTHIHQRLISANIRRSHRFAYSRQHGQKLEHMSRMSKTGRHADDTQGKHKAIAPHTKVWASGAESEASNPGTNEAPEKTNSIDGGRGHTGESVAETTASAIGTVSMDDLTKQTTPSQSTMTDFSTTGSRIRYPHPPKLRDGATVFRCPCCCITLPKTFTRRRRWRFESYQLLLDNRADSCLRKHIKEDILPYTCILSKCPDPDTLYAKKQTWMDHMLNDHNISSHWKCIICDDETEYHNESALTSHLAAKHAKAIPTHRIPMFLELCMQKIPEEVIACPLCDWVEDAESPIGKGLLLDHVAEHIHGFALRSLPWAPNGHEEMQARSTSTIAMERMNKWLTDCDAKLKNSSPEGTMPTLPKEPDSRVELSTQVYEAYDVYFDTHDYFAESLKGSSGAAMLSDSSKDSWDEDGASDSWAGSASGSIAGKDHDGSEDSGKDSPLPYFGDARGHGLWDEDEEESRLTESTSRRTPGRHLSRSSRARSMTRDWVEELQYVDPLEEYKNSIEKDLEGPFHPEPASAGQSGSSVTQAIPFENINMDVLQDRLSVLFGIGNWGSKVQNISPDAGQTGSHGIGPTTGLNVILTVPRRLTEVRCIAPMVIR